MTRCVSAGERWTQGHGRRIGHGQGLQVSLRKSQADSMAALTCRADIAGRISVVTRAIFQVSMMIGRHGGQFAGLVLMGRGVVRNLRRHGPAHTAAQRQ